MRRFVKIARILNGYNAIIVYYDIVEKKEKTCNDNEWNRICYTKLPKEFENEQLRRWKNA